MKKWIMILLFGLLLAGCVGTPLPPTPVWNLTDTLVVTAAPAGTYTPSPTVWERTSTATVTYTPSPTVDVFATLTYTEPIGPTHTQAACDQEELTAFKQEVTRIRNEFMTQFNRAREIQQQIVNSGSASISQTTELTNIYFALTGLASEAEQLDYPACADGARSKLIEAFVNYASAVQQIATYYTGTGGNLNTAEAKIATAERLMNEALDELEALAA